jgi:hypothetical protein
VVERRPGSAVLDVTVDGQSLRPRPVELEPGTAVVPIAYIADEPGHHRLAARLLLPGGRPRRASADAPLTVTAPRRLMVVTERATPPVAALALARHGADVHVVTPRELSARTGDLDAYHAVVLDDVARRGLPDATLAALAAWVAGGGALVVTGGEHLFGDPGFVGTPLERVLPVRLTSQTPEPEEREPIALYLLVDRSNSMAGVAAQDSRIACAGRAAAVLGSSRRLTWSGRSRSTSRTNWRRSTRWPPAAVLGCASTRSEWWRHRLAWRRSPTPAGRSSTRRRA